MNTGRLKIAITHTRFSFMGGIEKYIYSLVQRLLDAGHHVHYIAAKGKPLAHENFHFHKIPLIRFPPSLRVLSFNYFANQVLKQNSFDLIHGFTKTDTQDIYTDGSGCLFDFVAATRNHHSRLRRCLYLATPHQRAILQMEKRRFRKDAIRRIIPMADFVRKQILALYDVDPQRIEVVYNGVELDYFHPDNRERFAGEFRSEHRLGEEPLLLFVGNDWQRKGLDVVLRALPTISQKCRQQPKLLVAGHDNHPQRFQALAEKLQIAEQILWLGPVKEIRKPFAVADLFLFPSRYDVFGNVGLEVLASGVPALLSSKAGVSEVLEEPAGKILSNPESSEELAEAATDYLNPDRRSFFRDQARSVAEKYSWDRHFERIMEIYREVLEEKRGNKP